MFELGYTDAEDERLIAQAQERPPDRAKPNPRLFPYQEGASFKQAREAKGPRDLFDALHGDAQEFLDLVQRHSPLFRDQAEGAVVIQSQLTKRKTIAGRCVSHLSPSFLGAS
jgi:hypothetical protein